MSRVLRSGPVLSAGLALEDGLYKYLLLEKHLTGISIAKSISRRLDTLTAEEDSYGALFSHLEETGAPKDIPIVFALRFDESLIKIIDMQLFTVEEVKRTLSYQFDDIFPFAYKDGNFDVQEIFFPVSGKEEKRFMAAACRGKIIDEIKAGAERAGFSLSCVEPSQLSFERAATPEDCCENLIEIYAGRANVLFVLSNGKNGIFYRNAVIRQKGCQYIERAASEVRSSLCLACRNIPDFKERTVVITGPCASEPLREAVVQIVGHGEVNTINPFACHGAVSDSFAAAEMVLPLGAALRCI